MIKEDAFKTWLEQGGVSSDAGRNSRVSAIRTIERKLGELGVPYRDLDAAWEADRFVSLSERLRRMRIDARDGGQDYRILMPDSEKPHNRLSRWGSWLGQYGRFLAGEPPRSARDADRIGQFILLIDGGELARLMVAHDVSVRSRARHEIKWIDEDYFDRKAV